MRRRRAGLLLLYDEELETPDNYILLHDVFFFSHNFPTFSHDFQIFPRPPQILSTAYVRYLGSTVRFSARSRSAFSHIGLNCAPFGYALPVPFVPDIRFFLSIFTNSCKDVSYPRGMLGQSAGRSSVTDFRIAITVQ